MLNFLKSDCKYCGKKIKTVLSRSGYCSTKCEKQKKEDDSFFLSWKEGYTGYAVPFLDSEGVERSGIIVSFPYIGVLDIEELNSEVIHYGVKFDDVLFNKIERSYI